MKKLTVLFILAILVALPIDAQVLKGHVFDAQSNEPLVGANVSYSIRGQVKGTATDIEGAYEIALPEGGVDLVFTYLGYDDIYLPLVIKPRETLVRDIYMKVGVNLLEDVVVSAGRYEQKLSEITVSMDILKAADIAKQTPTDLSAVIKTLPGVDVNDKQPSIRGGSGWTYGVGARSLILVDGMSILNPGTGEINWNTIPMENIEQVEILKGASSVLYGSSALNGLINVRTARPGLTPKTELNAYIGIYGNPANEDYQWADRSLWTEGKYPVKPLLRNSLLTGVRNPIYEGFDFSHSRRIGNFDVSGGLNIFTDEGYKEQGYNKRFRLGGGVTYHQPGINAINYGINYNFLSNKYGDFFIWRSPGAAYSPSAFTNMGREGDSFQIDPFFNFANPHNNTTHRVKGRFYYRGDNIIAPTNEKSIVDILGNMGTNVGAITDIVGGDYSSLLPVLDPALSGDIYGVLDGLFSTLGTIFPTATTADYSDLISWFMNHGIPDSSDLVSWGADALNPKAGKTIVDHFYSYYMDYQFGKKFDGGAQITSGITYEHLNSQSVTAGTHNSDNIALFFQYDQRFLDRLSVSLGVRGEYYRVDSHYKEAKTKAFGVSMPFKPIFRGGLNYQLADYSFIRASFGQGYRYPSLVEKFARKDIGGAGVFPSKDLKAESGFNAELGLKQGYKIGGFQGFLDVAGFYTQYKDMIEFRFGLFDGDDYIFFSDNTLNNLLAVLNPVLNGDLGLGATFYNVSKARIYGVDLSTYGMYKISNNANLTYNLGYVYIQPEDADYKEKNAMEDEYTNSLQMKEKSNNSKYLKYRQKHTIKGTFDYNWKRLSVGTNVQWKSKTLAVDYFMVDERENEYGRYEVMDYVRDILFGNTGGENGLFSGETLNSYWKRKNKDYFIMDLRAGVKVARDLQVQMTINNLFNKEYSTRPMAVGAPRTYVMQVKYNF
ncbi:MAG: TonB-dependent receptor [Bacteroides sp.]|nr:TonB-dependent receptor [Bacteroides sp.]